MLQPASGAATFYTTLAAALEAKADGDGMTVKLCGDCCENVTVGKSCVIDTNHFRFDGSVTAAEDVDLDEAATADAMGEVRTVYTVTARQKPVEDPSVARIGETEYTDIDMAMAAAAAQKATLVLLADTTADVKLTPDWSLNLNGWQVSGAIDVAEDYKADYWLKRSGDNYSAVPYVAKIGNAKYGSLQAAVNAAKSASPQPAVVTLLMDCSENVILTAWASLDKNGFAADYVCAPNGFNLVPDADGRWGIEQANVAQLEGTAYKTLTEAIDAAGSWGAVVKLLKSTDEKIVIGKELTIELNGCTCQNVSADGQNRYCMEVADGQVIITHPDVARIGDAYYTDLQDAVDAVMTAADSKDTIILIKASDEDVLVDEAGSFVIDVTDFDFYGDVRVVDDSLSLGMHITTENDRTLAEWTAAAAKKVEVSAATAGTTEVATVKVSADLAAAMGGDGAENEIVKKVEAAIQEGAKSQGFAEVVKTKSGDNAKTEIRTELSKDVSAAPVRLADLGTGVYQPTKVVEVKVEVENGKTLTETVSVPDVSKEALTVIKNEAPEERLMLAVPGDKTENGEDFTVDNVIASTPVEGDQIQLYVYENGVGGYRMWSWNGTVWKEGVVDSTDAVSPLSAGNQKLTSGQAFWYKRNGHRNPVTVVAKYREEITTTIQDQGCINQEKNTVEPAWNMVANPVSSEMNLNAIVLEDEPGTSHADDSIVIPNDTGAGEKIYTLKNGKWGYEETVVEEKTLKGKTIKVLSSRRNDTNTVVRAGKGFWYLSNGGKPKIKWEQPANGNK